jgi:hypothetical protein
MLVTALSAVIGCDKATAYIGAADFDRIVNPAAMVGPVPEPTPVKAIP